MLEKLRFLTVVLAQGVNGAALAAFFFGNIHTGLLSEQLLKIFFLKNFLPIGIELNHKENDESAHIVIHLQVPLYNQELQRSRFPQFKVVTVTIVLLD